MKKMAKYLLLIYISLYSVTTLSAEPSENKIIDEQPTNQNKITEQLPDEQNNTASTDIDVSTFPLTQEPESKPIELPIPKIQEYQIPPQKNAGNIVFSYDNIHNQEQKKLIMNDPIFEGDIIFGKNAKISLNDGTLIFLISDTELKINKSNTNTSETVGDVITLISGSIRIISGFQANLGTFKVSIMTDEAIISPTKAAADFMVGRNKTITGDYETLVRGQNEELLIADKNYSKKTKIYKVQKSVHLIKKGYSVSKIGYIPTCFNKLLMPQETKEFINYPEYRNSLTELQRKYHELYTTE